MHDFARRFYDIDTRKPPRKSHAVTSLPPETNASNSTSQSMRNNKSSYSVKASSDDVRFDDTDGTSMHRSKNTSPPRGTVTFDVSQARLNVAARLMRGANESPPRHSSESERRARSLPAAGSSPLRGTRSLAPPDGSPKRRTSPQKGVKDKKVKAEKTPLPTKVTSQHITVVCNAEDPENVKVTKFLKVEPPCVIVDGDEVVTLKPEKPEKPENSENIECTETSETTEKTVVVDDKQQISRPVKTHVEIVTSQDDQKTAEKQNAFQGEKELLLKPASVNVNFENIITPESRHRPSRTLPPIKEKSSFSRQDTKISRQHTKMSGKSNGSLRRGSVAPMVKKKQAKKGVEESLFDSDRFNPDGSVRTMHTMPDFQDSIKEALKARYVRMPNKRAFEREMSISECWSKNNLPWKQLAQ